LACTTGASQRRIAGAGVARCIRAARQAIGDARAPDGTCPTRAAAARTTQTARLDTRARLSAGLVARGREAAAHAPTDERLGAARDAVLRRPRARGAVGHRRADARAGVACVDRARARLGAGLVARVGEATAHAERAARRAAVARAVL